MTETSGARRDQIVALMASVRERTRGAIGVDEELDALRGTRPGLRIAEALEQAGYTVVSDPHDPHVGVLALHAQSLLGYLRASDEWVDGTGEPLPDDMQEAAHDLVRTGLLPEFAHLV